MGAKESRVSEYREPARAQVTESCRSCKKETEKQELPRHCERVNATTLTTLQLVHCGSGCRSGWKNIR